MATRSTIALEYADGTIGQVYCHFDGYLEHNGKILLEHWSEPFKLRELIDIGDVSSLSKEIGTKQTPMTIFYSRDYSRDTGEYSSTAMARTFVDFQDYLAHHEYQEYEYILRKDGCWYVKFDSLPMFDALDQHV